MLLPAEVLKLPAAETARRLDAVFTLLPELRDLAPRRAAGLSGGQGKMVALGRALMVGTRAVLLDEPFQGLAPVLAHALRGGAEAAARGAARCRHPDHREQSGTAAPAGRAHLRHRARAKSPRPDAGPDRPPPSLRPSLRPRHSATASAPPPSPARRLGSNSPRRSSSGMRHARPGARRPGAGRAPHPAADRRRRRPRRAARRPRPGAAPRRARPSAAPPCRAPGRRAASGVLHHEDGDRQAKLVQQRRHAAPRSPRRRLLRRQGHAAPQPLAGMPHQVALHHIRRMFQRDGEGLHLRQPPPLLLAQRLLRDAARGSHAPRGAAGRPRRPSGRSPEPPRGRAHGRPRRSRAAWPPAGRPSAAPRAPHWPARPRASQRRRRPGSAAPPHRPASRSGSSRRSSRGERRAAAAAPAAPVAEVEGEMRIGDQPRRRRVQRQQPARRLRQQRQHDRRSRPAGSMQIARAAPAAVPRSARSPPASSSGFSALPRLAPSTMATAGLRADHAAARQRRRRRARRRRWNAPPRRPPRPAAGWAGACSATGASTVRSVGEASTGAMRRHHQVQRQQHQAEADGDPPEIAHLLALARGGRRARPASTSGGKTAVTSKDSSCTISAVPTLAPSIAASAGASADRPGRGEGADHQRRRGAGLQRRRDAEPGQHGAARGRPARSPSTCRSRLPKARCTPLCTMCRPQSSSAASPASSSSSLASPIFPRTPAEPRKVGRMGRNVCRRRRNGAWVDGFIAISGQFG